MPEARERSLLNQPPTPAERSPPHTPAWPLFLAAWRGHKFRDLWARRNNLRPDRCVKNIHERP